jgi:hypothetical protein
VVDEPREGVAAACCIEPRRHEPAAQHDDDMGEALPDKANHGKGAEGLAQVVQGHSGNGGIAIRDEGLKPAGKPGMEGIGLILAGGPEKVCGLEGGVPGVLVIGQAEGKARLPTPPLQEAVYVIDAAAIAVHMAVKPRASQPGKMLREPAPGPVRPGVKYLTGGSGRLSEESQLAFQVCIQDGAPDAVLPKAAGQPRNPARRLAGLGDGGVDQKKVGDGFSPYFGGTQFISWWPQSYVKPAADSLQSTAGGRDLLAVGC